MFLKRALLVACISLNAKSAMVDFDQSMLNPCVNKQYHNLYHIKKYKVALFKQLYEKNALEKLLKSSAHGIPKIIHFIWLGSPLPEKYKPFIERARALHPGWRVIVWTDTMVKKCKLYNQDLFDAATNWGEKSDILRLDLLWQYGGAYLDVDVKCLKPLDLLHEFYDLYAGLGPITNHIGWVNNAVIAARPKHPIITRYREELRKTKDQTTIIYRTGPKVFTRICKEMLRSCAAKCGRVILFPGSYFTPLAGNKQPIEPSDEKKYIRPESLAIHYYDGNWIPQKTGTHKVI